MPFNRYAILAVSPPSGCCRIRLQVSSVRRTSGNPPIPEASSKPRCSWSRLMSPFPAFRKASERTENFAWRFSRSQRTNLCPSTFPTRPIFIFTPSSSVFFGTVGNGVQFGEELFLPYPREKLPGPPCLSNQAFDSCRLFAAPPARSLSSSPVHRLLALGNWRRENRI